MNQEKHNYKSLKPLTKHHHFCTRKRDIVASGFKTTHPPPGTGWWMEVGTACIVNVPSFASCPQLHPPSISDFLGGNCEALLLGWDPFRGGGVVQNDPRIQRFAILFPIKMDILLPHSRQTHHHILADHCIPMRVKEIIPISVAT